MHGVPHQVLHKVTRLARQRGCLFNNPYDFNLYKIAYHKGTQTETQEVRLRAPVCIPGQHLPELKSLSDFFSSTHLARPGIGISFQRAPSPRCQETRSQFCHSYSQRVQLPCVTN